MSADAPRLDLRLHPKQGIALTSEATEIGYGGAAGGGKSHLGRVSAIYYSLLIAGLNTYLFRRTYNELQKNHMEGPTSLPALLKPLIDCKWAKIVKGEVRFKNGSKIFLCHCQHEKDVYQWLGPEMHYIIIEQAEQFSHFMIAMLRGRNRLPEGLNIPEQYKHLFPRILYTFNPGGISHSYFKKFFVSTSELPRGADGVSEIVTQPDSEGGKKRQFIQAKLDDNPSVSPVEYRKTLRGLPPKLAKALEEGDFDQVIGAFFPEVDRAKHLIKPIKIESHYTKIMGMDWGACGEGDPFAIGWFAVLSKAVQAKTIMGKSIVMPEGSLVCYRRWYGGGLPKITASKVADGIKSMEIEYVSMRVAGGDIEQQRGHGESIFEIFQGKGIFFSRADMRRQHGHNQYRERLIGKEDAPLIYYFENYAESLERTAALQHSINDSNDCVMKEDHEYDCDRYVCMARPWISLEEPKPKTQEEQFRAPTLNEIWEVSNNKL
jgi:hypothetical protein